MNKHTAMWDYIKQYPELTSFLYFNSISEFASETGLNPIYSQADIKQYSNGDMVRKYDFAIIQMQVHDVDGTSGNNVNVMHDVQNFMDWIAAQNRLKNFPDFGEKCSIQRIENLQNMPSLAGTSENGIAKYMFQCSVIYLEEME